MWMEFGKLLKKYRQKKGYSLDELATLSQPTVYPVYSKGTISKWERGLNRPTIGHVETMEKILSVPDNHLQVAAGYLPGSCGELTQSAKKQMLVDHWKEMAEIAKHLTVSRSDENEDGEQRTLKDDELLDQIDSAWDWVADNYSNFAMDCFCSHYKAELEATGIDLGNHRAILEILEKLAHGKVFKGECPICKDWL